MEACGIPLRAISRKMLKMYVCGTSFEIINLILPYTRADELIDIGSLLNYESQSACTWTHVVWNSLHTLWDEQREVVYSH